MKKIMILTAVAMSAAPLMAQNAPHRGLGIGDDPHTAPANADKPPGDEGRPTDSEKTPDERFIRKAGRGGRMEVKMAEMAVKKASREDIKAFASMLVKDHASANAELTEIAKSMGVEIPYGPGAGTPEGTQKPVPENDPSGRQALESVPKEPGSEDTMNKMQMLKDKMGMEFDTAYLDAVEKDHEKDIALFEKAGETVQNPALKGFIAKTLPVLKKHAAALEALRKKDPNNPDTKNSTTGETPAPGTPLPDGNPPNR